MSWEGALADLRAQVDQVERDVAEEAWERLAARPFAPPEIAQPPTSRQRVEAGELLERLARCQQRIAERMAATQAELGELGARRRGARSYASSGVAIDRARS